ncbi:MULTISPECIES: hypothetical protein [unclassified Streptomyces]|uniref:hypothetical protein n=1 Tax=unclassified Streptomyces TaxID=2593676 RepID=UPI003369C328
MLAQALAAQGITSEDADDAADEVARALRTLLRDTQLDRSVLRQTVARAVVASAWQAEFDDLLATLDISERAEAAEQLRLVVELISDDASAEGGQEWETEP